MDNKTFAIGDVHGCADKLQELIGMLCLQEGDELVFLGDYIDRGHQSMGVLDMVMALSEKYKVVALKGNHESMMELSLSEGDNEVREKWAYNWIVNGGLATLRSYGVQPVDCLEDLSLVTDKMKLHLAFIKDMPEYYETRTHIFVHATPRPDLSIEDQSSEQLLWRRAGNTEKSYGYNHVSGKTIVSGHTPQGSGQPKMLSDKNIIIDTGCFATGVLTAMNVDTGEFVSTTGGISWIVKN